MPFPLQFKPKAEGRPLPSAGSPLALKKQEKLFQILSRLNRVVICFSGGLDSTYLLWAAKQVLGKPDVLALTAVSQELDKEQRRQTAVMAASLDVRHEWLETEEFSSPNHIVTSVPHCFFCKDELYSKATKIADTYGMAVIDGLQFSDTAENLPGYESAKKWGVRHPLEDAGLNKEEIQALAKKAGLPLQNLSRHESKKEEGAAKTVQQIASAEAYLKKLGFRSVRVSPLNDDAAKIEMSQKEMYLAVAQSAKIKSYFSGLGRRKVFLDLEEIKWQ